MDIIGHKNTRKYCVYSTAAIGIGYIAYKAYQRNVYQNSIRYLDSIRASLNKYKSAVDKGGDIVQTVLTDLYEYVLQEESDVPLSVQRLAKLAQSKEVTTATRSTIRAAVEGLVGKEQDEDVGGSSGHEKSALDKVLEALLSEKGQNLVSVALGMAARNVVSSYVETQGDDTGKTQGGMDALFLFLSHPRGQELAVRCISACANSAMRAYMEKAADINYYDQLFSTMVKPNHVDMVKECISISIQAAVAAYMGCDEAEQVPLKEEHTQIKEIYTIVEDRKETHDGLCSPRDDDGADSPCSALRPPLSVGTPPAHDADFEEATSRRGLSHDIEYRSRLGLRQRRKERPDQHVAPLPKNDSLLRALGKEWIYVSQDPNSRDAIVSVVGCVTKEAVGAVAHTVADRLQMTWFLLVLLMGIFVSLIAQSILRGLGL
jgi:hypothetical protein